MKRISLIIADNNEIFRIGLSCILAECDNVEIVSKCCDGEEAIQASIEFKPDIIFMAESISNPDCIETSKRIKNVSPQTYLIIITEVNQQSPDTYYIFDTQANSYVDRLIDATSLKGVVNRSMSGGFFLSPTQGQRLIEEFNHFRKSNKRKLEFSFTNREEEILNHVANGLTNYDIADALYISPNTVKSHLSRIMQKMGLRNRREVMIAVKESLSLEKD